MEKNFFYNFFELFFEREEKKLGIGIKCSEINEIRKIDRGNIKKEIIKAMSHVGFRCLLLEFHVCDQSGKLDGKNIREKLDCYQNIFLSDKGYCESVLKVYPELEGICQDMAEKQIILIWKMFLRLRKDKPEIEKKLLGGKKFKEVKKIRMGQGDPHCGGRSVIKLYLDCGMSIFYKFHSAVNGKVFYGLMERIERNQNSYDGIYQYIDCGEYSWVKEVKYQAYSSEGQIRLFFERIGMMAGVSYLLGSHDLHYQNLIAYGEYPLLVDLENLFQTDEESFRIGESLRLSYSVLNSNLFPMSMQAGRFCAVTGGNGDRAQYEVPMLHMDDEDIAVVYEKPEMGKGRNLPKRGKEAVEVIKYLAEIEKGFDRAYQYFQCTGRDKIQEILKEDIVSRHLVHGTQLYYHILEASYHPSLMMERGGREAFIRRICPSGQLREWEIADLMAGDIPYFYRKADRRSLFTSSGEEIRDYFKETVLEAVVRRKDAMNDEDRRLQHKLIRSSLELSNLNEKALENGVYFCEEGKGEETEWMDIALEMADRIAGNAVWNEDKTKVTWLTWKCSAKKEVNVVIDVTDYYLYEGMAGIIVFMRAMNLECGRYDKLCNAAESALFKYTDGILDGTGKTASRYTGAYCGESSIVYAYQILYGMTGNRNYLSYAEKHTEIVMGLIEEDVSYDILYGNAGAILVLCNMYELTQENKYLEYAQKAECFLRRHLYMCEKGAYYMGHGLDAPCAGMAHGNSGFIMSYGRLFRYIKETAYKEILDSLIDYENAAFLKRISEGYQTDWESSDLPSWCHGDMGIALAYLDLKENTGAVFDSETSVVLGRIRKIAGNAKLRRSMSLCHGNIGNLLMMEQFAFCFREQELAMVHEFRKKVKGAWKRGGIIMEIEKRNWGLMGGCAGIRYGY